MNLIAICFIVIPLVSSQVIVDTEYGQVEGHIIPDVWNGDYSADVVSFLAVPYAKPPIGQLRFAVRYV